MDEALLKKLCRAINFLLSLYNVNRVFALMNFKKQWSSFIIFAYI